MSSKSGSSLTACGGKTSASRLIFGGAASCCGGKEVFKCSFAVWKSKGFVSGHGFSRAVPFNIFDAALAAETMVPLKVPFFTAS
jgi:hypothetical protein